MTEDLPTQRVAVQFVGTPPAQQIARAAGVRDVEVDGHQLRCVVCGSFQPFLEALMGYEVIALSAIPVPSIADDGCEPAAGERNVRDEGGG